MTTKSQKIRIAGMLAPHWKSMTMGIVAAVASAGLDLLQPFPLKIVVDYVVGSKTAPQWLPADRFVVLNIAAASIVAIAVLGAIASYVENVLTTRVGQWVTHDLRTTLYDHVQRLSLTYHDKSRTGDLVSRVTNDIDTIQSFITSTILDAFIDVVTLGGMIVIMGMINFRFTLVALAVAPFLFAFVYKYTHRIKTLRAPSAKGKRNCVERAGSVFVDSRGQGVRKREL
jgi:subfamily B ATP-binding cassette protein MsbA